MDKQLRDSSDPVSPYFSYVLPNIRDAEELTKFMQSRGGRATCKLYVSIVPVVLNMSPRVRRFRWTTSSVASSKCKSALLFCLKSQSLASETCLSERKRFILHGEVRGSLVHGFYISVDVNDGCILYE